MTATIAQTLPAPAAASADAGVRASAAAFLLLAADARALLRGALLLPILLLLRLSGPWAPRT